MQSKAHIMLGSSSDQEVVGSSELTPILEEMGVSWGYDIISAHRNGSDLQPRCQDLLSEGVEIFICAAGLAAALPGSVKSYVGEVPVFGVALDQFGHDSVWRMPPGVPVLSVGSGDTTMPSLIKGVLKNTGLAVCEILALKYPSVKDALRGYNTRTHKPPVFNARVEGLQRYRQN